MSIFSIFFDTFAIRYLLIEHKVPMEIAAMPEFDPKLPYNDLPALPPPLELIECIVRSQALPKTLLRLRNRNGQGLLRRGR